MASNGHELFVADSRDNRIRVVTLDPVKTYQVAEAANNNRGGPAVGDFKGESEKGVSSSIFTF